MHSGKTIIGADTFQSGNAGQGHEEQQDHWHSRCRRDGTLVAAVTALLVAASPASSFDDAPFMRAAHIRAGDTRAVAIALMGQEPSVIENRRLGGMLDVEALQFQVGVAEAATIHLMFGRVVAVKTRQGLVTWDWR